jgi:hypothetical protein
MQGVKAQIRPRELKREGATRSIRLALFESQQLWRRWREKCRAKAE